MMKWWSQLIYPISLLLYNYTSCIHSDSSDNPVNIFESKKHIYVPSTVHCRHLVKSESWGYNKSRDKVEKSGESLDAPVCGIKLNENNGME